MFHMKHDARAILLRYGDVLETWGRNLAIGGKRGGRRTIDQRIERSLQLLPLLEKTVKKHDGTITIADMGSGVGIPAIPLAVAAAHQKPNCWQRVTFHLVEKQRRRALLLQEIVRRLQLPQITVHHDDLDTMESLDAHVFTAATVASLDTLCRWMERHKSPAHCAALLLKGRGFLRELHQAQKSWIIDYDIHSLDQGGVMLRLNHWTSL